VSRQDEVKAAGAEDFSRRYALRAQRFARICRQQRRVRPPAAPASWRQAAGALAGGIDSALACIDAPALPELAARVGLAIDEAYRQAGSRGAGLVVTGLRRIAELHQPDHLVHGTGSWALSGILRDGALVPGGDGLTGEVALTNMQQRDLFVCELNDAASMYAAASFAYMNAACVGDGLLVSAVRAGSVPIAELVGLLLFGDENPVLTPQWSDLARRMIRFRTLERDSTLGRACDEALRLARSGDLKGDGRQYSRRLGAPDDSEVALTNVYAAIVDRIARDTDLLRLRNEERLAAGVRRYAPELKQLLLCPLTEDDAAERDRKSTLLEALQHQFPVILVLNGDGIACRADPNYPWSDERLVRQPIDAARIDYAYVPLDVMGVVQNALNRAGLQRAEVVPLEELEAVRLVAEAVPDGT
jgi:hypothetical protein